MFKTILWDFDGVILDSMKIRDWGFEEVFKNFKKNIERSKIEVCCIGFSKIRAGFCICS